MIRSRTLLVAALLGCAGLACSQQAPGAAAGGGAWWMQPFSVRSGGPFREMKCHADGADAGRPVTHAGWYGDWHVADPNTARNLRNALDTCGRIPGFKKIGYFDPGEVGEYVVMLDDAGEIVYTAWTMAQAVRGEGGGKRQGRKGRRGKRAAGPEEEAGEDGAGGGPIRDFTSAAWFGYPQFLFANERQRFAIGRAWPEPPPVLRTYDGRVLTTPQQFLSDVCDKGLDGELKDEYVAPVSPDRLGPLTGKVARLLEDVGVGMLKARAEVRGKTGAGTVHWCHIDHSNLLYRRLLESQIGEVYGKPLPGAAGQSRPVLGESLDGIHMDNVGGIPFGKLGRTGFGDWALDGFAKRLAADADARGEFERACRADAGMKGFVTADAGVDGIRRCFAGLARAHAAKGDDWRRDWWLSFRPFRILLSVHSRGGRELAGALYTRFKSVLRPREPLLVTGNLIPLLPGRLMSYDVLDQLIFEWRYDSAVQTLTEPGDYPGGFAFLGRLGAQGGRTGRATSGVYVPKNLSDEIGGERQAALTETVHRMLFFAMLPNDAILDSGYQFRDGYSPGTERSRTELNRYVSANRDWLGGRQGVADIGLVFSPESQIATVSLHQFYTNAHNDEYFAWANLLTMRQHSWDVLLAQKLNAQSLQRYRAVVLPEVLALDPAQRDALAAYARGGGRVVVTGDSGRFLGLDTGFRTAGPIFGDRPPAGVAACPGTLMRKQCDGAALLDRLGIDHSVRASAEPGTFVRAFRATADPRVVFVDVNRWRAIDRLGTTFEPNAQPISIQLAIDGAGGCARATTLDDGGARGSGDWGTVQARGNGRFDLALKPGAVRFYRSIRIQTDDCG